MSLFWDRKSYGTYKYTIGNKFTAREKLIYTKWYPCPGNIAHGEVIGERRADLLFERFQKRPQKSYRVYWRSHPDEYSRMCKTVRPKAPV